MPIVVAWAARWRLGVGRIETSEIRSDGEPYCYRTADNIYLWRPRRAQCLSYNAGGVGFVKDLTVGDRVLPAASSDGAEGSHMTILQSVVYNIYII